MSFCKTVRSIFKPAAPKPIPNREQSPSPPPPIETIDEVFIPNFPKIDKANYPLASRSSVDPDMGGTLTPKLVVWHHTVSYDTPGTENWFRTTAADIHLLVGKKGEVVQMVPFNRIAHHAGTSSWKGLQSLNNHAIGIEFVNLGPLKKVGEGYQDYYGRAYNGEVRKRKAQGFDYWEPFTEAQEQRFLEIGLYLYKAYGLTADKHIGHYECSPGRKNDPAGGFSWGDMNAAREKLREYIEAAKRRGLA